MVYYSKSSSAEIIGTGSLDLSSVTTLTPRELTSTSVVRSATLQGGAATFTLSFTTPGVLLDASTIQLGLPINQIMKSGSSFICTDPSTSTALTCTVSPTATSTYNYLTINEWKCTSGNCASGTTFNIQLTNAQNPAVAAVTTDPFTIDFISPSSNKIFQAPTTLDASPALEVGALNNHVVTHQNTQYTLSTTEYVISYDTTAEVPAGGKFIFTFPDKRIWKDSSSTLVVTTGTSFGTTVSGVAATYDSTGVWVTQIELTGLCTTACATGSYQFKFAGGIKNPDYVEPLTGNFVSYTTDSSGSVVNRDIKANSDVTEILPTPITASISRSNKKPGETTGLTVTFTTVNPFPDEGKILFKMPTDQITVGTSPTCLLGDLTTSVACSVAAVGSYYVSIYCHCVLYLCIYRSSL